jgi:hypothetical protein
VTDVVEEPVATTRDRGETGHRLGEHFREACVKRLDGLARLEVRVGILRGAADDGTIRIEGARSMRANHVAVDQGAQCLVIERHDLGDLVRRPEAIEEVENGHARTQRHGVPDGRQVLGLLRRSRSQERHSGGTRRHDVGMVTEDGERMRRDGSSRDVHTE